MAVHVGDGLPGSGRLRLRPQQCLQRPAARGVVKAVQRRYLLGVDRIDHGNRALEDPALVERLVRQGVTLTVCPLSNLKLCVVDDMARHPIPAMLRQGLRATINSDDPAYFGGYLGQNWIETAQALDLSRDDLITLAKNSFTGSFLPEAEVAARMAEIDAYVAGA